MYSGYQKRLGTAALAAAILLSGLAGCGTAGKKEDGRAETELASADEMAVCEDKGTVPGWQRDSQDKVTLDWYINYSWFTTPWGENAVSKKITEETGIDIHFMTPMGIESEKFNSLIASDSLPDLITLGWWEPQLDEMIKNDMVYAINELADRYDPYFYQVADPQVCRWYEKEDGNLYCYPNSTFTAEDYEKNEIGSNQVFMVRKDIYEAIGSPDMTTPEGFSDAVRKAAAAFPEVEGGPLIPIGAHMFTNDGCLSFDQYLQNFLAIPYEKDGMFYDRCTDPEYIRWLKVFRQLGEEGYLKEDIFIDQRTQMEEKLEQGRYFCMIYQRTDMEKQQKALYAKNPDSVYMAVDGPKNSALEDPVLPGAGLNGWTVTLISKNCKRPDRAIELFTYLMSEHGQMMTYLGVEGITYDMVDGKPVVKKEVQDLLARNREEYDRLYGADDAYWMFQNQVMQLKWKPKGEDPMTQLIEWSYPYTKYLAQYEINMNVDTEAGHAYQEIQRLWGETLPELLLAPTEEEFDEILESFVERRKEMDFDKVMEESTRQVREAEKKMGLRG